MTTECGGSISTSFGFLSPANSGRFSYISRRVFLRFWKTKVCLVNGPYAIEYFYFLVAELREGPDVPLGSAVGHVVQLLHHLMIEVPEYILHLREYLVLRGQHEILGDLLVLDHLFLAQLDLLPLDLPLGTRPLQQQLVLLLLQLHE